MFEQRRYCPLHDNHSFSYELRNGIGVKRQSQFVLQLLEATTGPHVKKQFLPKFTKSPKKLLFYGFLHEGFPKAVSSSQQKQRKLWKISVVWGAVRISEMH